MATILFIGTCEKQEAMVCAFRRRGHSVLSLDESDDWVNRLTGIDAAIMQTDWPSDGDQTLLLLRGRNKEMWVMVLGPDDDKALLQAYGQGADFYVGGPEDPGVLVSFAEAGFRMWDAPVGDKPLRLV